MKGNKRSVSKPKEIKSSPIVNKTNLMSKQSIKDNQPTLSKNALDLIDKISDERFKNIKSHLEKETKKSSIKVNATNPNKKPQPEYPVLNNSSNILHSNTNKLFSNNKKNFKNPNLREDEEKLVRRIQRWFRRILSKRKKDPQLEMKKLLKEKKMSILRNLNKNSNSEISYDSVNKMENDVNKVVNCDKDNLKMNSTDNEGGKRNEELLKKKENLMNKRNEAYNQKNSILMENLETNYKVSKEQETDNMFKKEKEGDRMFKKEKEGESMFKKEKESDSMFKKEIETEIMFKKVKETNIMFKKEQSFDKNQKSSLIASNRDDKRKDENFDFNNSIGNELSELNINNIFTPNSKYDLNFNNNSKNIFSPLRNVNDDEDKVNYYNPLFTNDNNSVNQDIKPQFQNNKEHDIHIKKPGQINFQISQSITKEMESMSSVIREPLNNNDLSCTNKINLSDNKNENDSLIMTTLNQKDQSSNSPKKYSFIENESKLESNSTNEKINQILNYLDDTKKYSPKSKSLSQIISNGPNANNYISQSKKTTAEILNMALELKEYKNTVTTMKQVIEELKQVSKQKDEYYKDQYVALQEKVKSDLTLTTNNKDAIIDNLVSEKRSLSMDIDRLNDELSKIELSYNKKISLLNDNFENERKKDKDAWYVAEKTRRKKWEETRMKEIKEMTIKGLEPEIERILQNHKQEMLKWEENLNDELRKQKDRLNKEFEKRLTEQREKYTKEKEEALEHERTLFLQRARNQTERFEDEYSEERRRWNSNLNAEISKLEGLREKDKKLYEDENKSNEEKHHKMLEEKEELYRQRVLDLEKRLNEKMALEIQTANFKANKDKEAFVEEKNREFDLKYNNMKSDIMKDKEKQIEIIINKLGDETISERRKMQVECESKAEERNKQLKQENEQMRNRICEITDKLSGESKVRIMLDENLNVLSKRIMDFELESAKKDKKILELSSYLNEYKDKYSNVAKDFTKEKISIETDYQIKIDKHINEMKIMTEKYESLRNYYESKINEMKQFHDSQINMLDTRVKKKLESKEDIIKKLQEDNEYKNLTIQKYEEMLSRQRKELLFNN